MKVFSKTTQRSVMSVAAIAMVLMGASMSAFAVPAKQIARVLNIQEFNVQCCVPIGPAVQVTEPNPVVPVLVTWSVDYVVADTTLFELSVNGGPCLFFGSGEANISSSGTGGLFVNGTYQWAVLPGDAVLKPGLNTFTVCAGGFGKPVKIDIGSNVLAVRISK